MGAGRTETGEKMDPLEELKLRCMSEGYQFAWGGNDIPDEMNLRDNKDHTKVIFSSRVTAMDDRIIYDEKGPIGWYTTIRQAIDEDSFNVIRVHPIKPEVRPDKYGQTVATAK